MPDRNSPLANIPNRVGFQFIGVRHDGTLARCHVAKNEWGCHVVAGEATYEELANWYETIEQRNQKAKGGA